MALGGAGLRGRGRPHPLEGIAETPIPTPAPQSSSAAGAARVVAGAARVVLFADLSEVDEAEGCGAIIRGVRDARRRGLATEEIDARNGSDAATPHRLLLAPTLIVLDGAGRELKRFEGESPQTIRAIQAELERLAAAR